MIFERIIEFKEGYDAEQTIKEIGSSIQFKGFNLLILICAAFLASIGLDTNSAAVIIGAMLISPLMSPILGVGLALGINDREMILSSIKNLAFATFIALFVSYIYFLLTPLGIPTPEILARTQPTLLDVLVAFFGGVAGIIAGARKDKTNAIPGVAIATALMPPLCTAGYGVATQQWTIFLGAFYLFFINAVFISLSTYLIVKYLDFPLKSYIDQNKARRVRRAMIFLLILIVSPSVFFLFNVYKDVKVKKQIEQTVINKIESFAENQVLTWEVIEKDSINEIKIYEAGDEITDSTLKVLNHSLQEEGLKNYRIKIIRVNMSKDEVETMSKEITKDYLDKIILENKLLSQQAVKAEKKPEADKRSLYSDLKILYPDIRNISLGSMIHLSGTDTIKMDTSTAILIAWSKKMNKKDEGEIKSKFENYFKKKLNKDSVHVEIK